MKKLKVLINNMDQENNKPKVGVGVMVFKDGKVLLGKRKGSHGEGEYSFPGGHLEYMESFEECAQRETLEEVGIHITNITFQFLSNVTVYAPKHYVHVGVTAEWESGDLVVMEPEKCESWDWYDVDNLPSPLFYMCQQSIDALKTKQIYIK